MGKGNMRDRDGDRPAHNPPTRKLSPLAVIALVVASAGASAQQARPETAAVASGDPVKGREHFIAYQCAYCHGTEGQGGQPAVGPRIARVSRSADSFIAYVRKPSGRMSAYSEASIPDVVLRDVYAYLRSLPQAKPATEIPLLDQLRKPGGR